MTGKVRTNMNWATMNIQNLKESIRDIAGRNELHDTGSKFDPYFFKFGVSKRKFEPFERELHPFLTEV